MAAKKPTMREIAREVGTSAVTVSKAMAGKTGMSDELRMKILKKASEIGLLYYAKQPEPLRQEKREYEYRHEPVDLLRAMYRIYARGGKAAPPDFTDSVPRRIVYSVRDKSLQILQRIRKGSVTLHSLYLDCRSRSEEVVATFLSILELCSIGSLRIERREAEYELSFIGGDVDEIMEKIVE